MGAEAEAIGIRHRSWRGFARVAILTIPLIETLGISPASAWGAEGHNIIAYIAASELTPNAKASVSDLLEGDAASSMVRASTWADEIRSSRRETAPWHYVNIRLQNTGYVSSRDCMNDDCVVAQVQRDIKIIGDKSISKPIRAEALRFLIHFVGDVHQPLHCVDNDDRGGNSVRVRLNGTQTNLHAVWDSSIVETLGLSASAIAVSLEKTISKDQVLAWQHSSVVEWANESFNIARGTIYTRLPGKGQTEAPILLPATYAHSQAPVVANQLEKAGVRLAGILNRSFLSPVFTSSVAPTTQVRRAIGFAESGSYVGQSVTVEGIIADVHQARGGTVFLDFGGVYPNSIFTAVIFQSDVRKFYNLQSLKRRKVAVFGEVKMYRGKPEVILSSPDQLKILN